MTDVAPRPGQEMVDDLLNYPEAVDRVAATELSKEAYAEYSSLMDGPEDRTEKIISDVQKLEWDEFADAYGVTSTNNSPQSELYHFLKRQLDPTEETKPNSDVSGNGEKSRSKLLIGISVGAAAFLGVAGFIASSLSGSGDTEAPREETVADTAPATSEAQTEEDSYPSLDEIDRLVWEAEFGNMPLDENTVGILVSKYKSEYNSGEAGGRLWLIEKAEEKKAEQDKIAAEEEPSSWLEAHPIDESGNHITEIARLHEYERTNSDGWSYEANRPEGYDPEKYMTSWGQLEPLNTDDPEELARRILDYVELSIDTGGLEPLMEIYNETNNDPHFERFEPFPDDMAERRYSELEHLGTKLHYRGSSIQQASNTLEGLDRSEIRLSATAYEVTARQVDDELGPTGKITQLDLNDTKILNISFEIDRKPDGEWAIIRVIYASEDPASPEDNQFSLFD